MWINEKHVEQQLGHKNLQVVASKYSEEYRKCRYELIDKPTKHSHRRLIHNDLVLKIVMNWRTDESCNLKRNIGCYTMLLILKNKQ